MEKIVDSARWSFSQLWLSQLAYVSVPKVDLMAAEDGMIDAK